jgi:hypothetical protein
LRRAATKIDLGENIVMKHVTAVALVAALGFASSAWAGARIEVHPESAASPATDPHDSHPRAQAISTSDLKISVTEDRILRSCCLTNLVVLGKITNTGSTPIDYVKLLLTFENQGGRIVYIEDTYNHGAVTMFEDPEIAKVLHDRPHFTALKPGQSDTFQFTVPYDWIPPYTKVQLLTGAIVRNLKVAQAN